MYSRSGTSPTSHTELLHLTSVPAATAFVDGGRRRDDESERVSAAHRVRFRYPHHPRARGRVEAADPAERSPWNVRRCDQALLAALDHLRPGVQTIRCKPPHRVDEADARDDIFEARPALVQWPLADIRSDPGSGPSSTGLTG